MYRTKRGWRRENFREGEREREGKRESRERRGGGLAVAEAV